MKIFRAVGHFVSDQYAKSKVRRGCEYNCLIKWRTASKGELYCTGHYEDTAGREKIFAFELNDEEATGIRVDYIEITEMNGSPVGVLNMFGRMLKPYYGEKIPDKSVSREAETCESHHTATTAQHQVPKAGNLCQEGELPMVGTGNAIRQKNNEIELIVDVAPVKGSGMQDYSVSAVSCPQLPFLGEEILRQIEVRQLCDKDKDQFKELAERSAIAYLDGFGYSVGAKAGLRFGTGEMNPFELDVPKNVFVNLYVDLGSTNSKWIVENVAEDGTSLGFRTMWSMSTDEEIIRKWGIDYNKEFAYQLDNNKFKEWLAYAALGFMRQIQKAEQANIVNITWSFPRLAGKDGIKTVEFENCSKFVTHQLRKWGLLGKFELMRESDSLKWMFWDVVRLLARESEREVQENEKRKKQEEINKVHNEAERKKRNDTIDRERKQWEQQHGAVYKFFHTFHPEKMYRPEIRETSLGRLELMKAFRNTGARGDGDFDILILDAGGSTLDFCFIKYDENYTLSGSYLAGGNKLTSLIQDKYHCESFVAAEEWKRKLSEIGGDKQYLDMTVSVYGDSIAELAKKISRREDRSLCVIVSGLAMMNPCLRKIIEDSFKLKDGQMLMFSPDMAMLFTDELCSKHKAIDDFNMIVRRNSVKQTPWPAFDVAGGLYFYRKERNKND